MSLPIQHCSRECATKVVYEMKMLYHTFRNLTENEIDTSNMSTNDISQSLFGTGWRAEETRDIAVYLESFLIHARTLYYFFSSERSRDDDILAKDFIANWSSSEAWDKGYLKQNLDRLSKSLAHLTTKRVKYESENECKWDVPKILREIDTEYETFLNRLFAEQRSWFDDPL